MRPVVRFAIIAGVLIVAACTVYALRFAVQTNDRLVRLEQYINGRTSVRNDQYEQQQRDIDRLEQQLCRADPASCTP